MKGAGDLIRQAVTSWPGVETFPHRFGGTEYRYGRKEMGHVHGDRLADLPLGRALRDEMAGPEDAAGVIELFRVQYDRYRKGAARTA